MIPLPTILRLNALSCLLFGSLFAAAPGWVSALIGNPAPLVLRLVGLGLVFNGLHLLLAARRPRVVCAELLYFIAGDFAWVTGTLVLVALGLGITTQVGLAAAVALGAMVGAFGFLQLRHARQLCSSHR